MKRKALMKTAAAVFAAAMMLTGCAGGSDVSDLVDQATTEVTETPADTTEPAADTETPAEPEVDPLEIAEGTTLVMSCGYNNAKTGMRFDAEVAGDGVTLADGVTYHTGDFKPTWVAIQETLGFEIDDQYAGDKDTDNYTKWTADADTLASIDMFSGSAAQLQEGGAAGNILNLADYFDVMPNFKAFLDANPVVRMSLTGSIDGDDAGAIYGSPYFDGLDDIEKMPLMRADWVIALLDGEGEFAADASDKTATPVYQPYMPTSGKVTVDVVKADGSGVEQVTKDYDAAGNIVDKMNAAGSISGVEAVNMLRTYIDEAYAGYYGTTRSDLFIGQNAAWDADELVALLRCVCANSATLNADGSKVEGLFPREAANNARRADLYRLASTLFGVRGLESRQDYLFFDKDGVLHDARQEDATYDALLRLNDLVKEGLIAADFVASSEDNATKSADYIKNDTGFMSYDYNQTQTIFNEDGKLDSDAGEKYMAVMIPVARWDDGTGEQYMRFTESWRSSKTGGWAIASHVADDVNKLHACLKLIDYAYTYEGQVLLSYGPEAFRNDAVIDDFYGMPAISEQTYADLWNLAGGNYTNFARQYLGSTLSFHKTQAFEMQCTTAVGKEGLNKVTKAISLGVIKHPVLELQDNMFYTIVPTVLPTTDAQNDLLKQNADLNNSFSTSKLENNVFLNVIIRGTTAATDADAGVAGADAATMIANDWNGATYLQVKNQAWDMLKDYATSNF
ncbi:MAG: hypothetical protein K5669_04820 [Lachnospiraceae bacterium]|nr:hypothetical protein [Lachnospiraceae bacterium]